MYYKYITPDKLILLESVDSTNNFAIELIKKGAAAEGTAIIAKTQSSGKGQEGNGWESEPGKNLTCSIIFCPKFLSLSKQFMLNKMISLAIKDFVETFITDKKVKVKWPNDVYIENFKVAGILIQNIIQGTELEYSVLGIGLNINQDVFKSKAPNPVSLKIITGKDYDLQECFNLVYCFLEKRYNQLRNGEVIKINSEYLNSLFGYNTFMNFVYQSNSIKAKIINIMESGKLLLEKEDGSVLECDMKEIRFI